MLPRGVGFASCALLRLLFHDKAGAAADGGRKFKGLAWLFMGPLDFAAHAHTITFDKIRIIC